MGLLLLAWLTGFPVVVTAGHLPFFPRGVSIRTGSMPQGTICRNKGYVSGFTKLLQEGDAFLKCCSSMDYTYSERSCVWRRRTTENLGSNLPAWYLPVGGTPLRNAPGEDIKYCVFVRRLHMRSPARLRKRKNIKRIY